MAIKQCSIVMSLAPPWLLRDKNSLKSQFRIKGDKDYQTQGDIYKCNKLCSYFLFLSDDTENNLSCKKAKPKVKPKAKQSKRRLSILYGYCKNNLLVLYNSFCFMWLMDLNDIQRNEPI